MKTLEIASSRRTTGRLKDSYSVLTQVRQPSSQETLLAMTPKSLPSLRAKRSNLRVFLWTMVCGLLTFSFPLHAARSDEVDDAHRLQFLRQATGASSGSQSANSSFQARMDAILDTTPSSERRTVAVDDAAERQRIFAAEQSAFKTELEASPDPLAMKTQEKTKIKNLEAQAKLNATEEEFQKSRTSIQEEFDINLQKALEKKAAPVAEEEEEAAGSSLAPSLANNPFYFAPEKEGGSPMSFQERKSIIASRLMDMRGLSPEEADAIVMQASSSDELVLQLVQEYEFSYGEASDLTS